MTPQPYKTQSSRADMYEPFRFFDEITRDFFSPTCIRRESRADLRTDILDEGDRYTLYADLPGFRRENIHLDVSDDTLTLCAVREGCRDSEEESSSYIRMERSYGTYKRQFDMSGIDTEGIKASYADGVLTLTLPKKAEGEPKRRMVTID